MIDDYTVWRFWFDIIQLSGTLAIGLYVWWDRRKKETEKRFCTLEEVVNGHSLSLKSYDETKHKREKDCEKHRQQTNDLEKDVHHLPSRQELSDLSGVIGTLTEKLGKLDGQLAGIERVVRLLNQHHLRAD